MPTCMGSSPVASSAVSMDVDGIDSSLSPPCAPLWAVCTPGRRRVHPCGLVALDALLGGGFPCRALSQVFLVSVLGLPMRSHVDYDFIGLLLATHSDRRIYIIDAGGLLCAGSLERGVARHCSDLHDALGRVDFCFPRDLDGLWLCWARVHAECILMGSETRTRYSAVFVYGLANHFPIIAKRAPCARLKHIVLGLHRIAVDLGLISVMFDRVVSSGDNRCTQVRQYRLTFAAKPWAWPVRALCMCPLVVRLVPAAFAGRTACGM